MYNVMGVRAQNSTTDAENLKGKQVVDPNVLNPHSEVEFTF